MPKEENMSITIMIHGSDIHIEVLRGVVVPQKDKTFAAKCVGRIDQQEFPFEIRNLTAVHVVQFGSDVFLGHVGFGLGDLRELVGFDNPQQLCGKCKKKCSYCMTRCPRCGGSLVVRPLRRDNDEQ
jgi:hypothetical protein